MPARCCSGASAVPFEIRIRTPLAHDPWGGVWEAALRDTITTQTSPRANIETAGQVTDAGQPTERHVPLWRTRPLLVRVDAGEDMTAVSADRGPVIGVRPQSG